MVQALDLSRHDELLRNPLRIQALEETDLLDSPPEEAFDRLTRLATEILDASVAMVSLVDDHRQFFKSQCGLDEPAATTRGTPLSRSLCQYVVTVAEPIIIADTRRHPLFQEVPAVVEDKVIAYLGIPLTTAEGETLGSFCAIERQPRTWTHREIRIMQELAAAVMTEVQLRLMVFRFHENCVQLRNAQLEREDLVQMLVHDLRNPLTSMMLGLHLLQSPKDQADAERRVKTVHRGAEVMLRMVNEILDVSKSEAGRLDLQLEKATAAEILDSTCELVAEIAKGAGVTLKTNVAPDVPAIRVDKEKIRRVLVNLISNAIQHTAERGFVTVTVTYNAALKRIIFEVADTGVGIPKESFGKVFEKYHSTIRTKSGKFSTGLGLTFCKLAVEAHGGEIQLESELGKGTTFRVEIPETPPKQA